MPRWAFWAFGVCAVLAIAMFCWASVASGSILLGLFWAAVVVAFVGPVPLSAVMATWRERRSAAVRGWVTPRGWHYDRTSTAVARIGRDVLRRELDGVEVLSYETIAAPDLLSEAPASSRHAVAARVAAHLPTLVIVPEGTVRATRSARLGPDVQFESAAFNDRWRVHCADAQFAHAFCHPRVMERLMRDDARGVSVLVDGRDVVVHAAGRQVLENLDGRASLAADLALLVPPYVVEQHPLPTRRPRRRVSEHSRGAAALAVVWTCAWLAFLARMGADGGMGVALGFGVPTVAVLATVLVAAARRRKG